MRVSRLAIVLALLLPVSAYAAKYRVRIPLFNIDTTVEITEIVDPVPMPEPVPVPPPPVVDPPPPAPEPVPVPVPEPEPTPQPQPPASGDPVFPEVIDVQRPFLWPDDALERVAASPATWALVVTNAEVNPKPPLVLTDIREADQCLCAYAVWRLGLPKIGSQKYALTADQYRDRAVASLMRMCEPKLDKDGKPLPAINLAGSHYDYRHIHPIPLGRNWLRSVLSDEQQQITRDVILEALKATDGGQKELDLIWNGYNHDAGEGMTLALAIHGETGTDWVQRYWKDCWWSTPPPEKKGVGGLYNREYERNWQKGGGTREGWPYFADQAALVFARAVWESATGDLKSLSYPWFDKMPHLLLHESVQFPPGIDPTTKKSVGWRPFALPVWEYGGEYWGQAGFGYILAAGTGSRDKQTAALSAWLLSRWGYSRSTDCEELIFRCLIGDPRVKPQSPADLGLPLDYTTEGTGYHFDRTDWSDDSTRVFFGAGEVLVRNEPRGDVMVWSKGLPLIAGRTSVYAHHYSGPERMNVICLRDSDGKIIKRLGGSTTPIRKKTCSFQQTDEGFVAELQGLYPGKAELLRRTWSWDRTQSTIAIRDEVRCAEGITPLICWNTPEKPTVGDTVTFSNGRATATMLFDRTPKEVICRGGETEQLWTQVYDGTLYEPAQTDKLWLKAAREQKVLEGGFYTVYVVPPFDTTDNTFRLTTIIRVN